MLASLALASCSKNQVLDTPKDAIKFNVVADKATKAANVYCNSNPITAFNVWASYKNASNYVSYFANDLVEGANGSWGTEGIVRYWPAFAETGSSLTFYALAGTTSTFDSWAATSTEAPVPTISNYQVNTTVASQEDLLYSRSQAYTAKATNADLNFRHALSLIEFKAKNSTSNLHVKVTKVCVGGVYGQGDFTFPTAATSTNYANHNDNATTEDNTNNATEMAVWVAEGSDVEYVTDVNLAEGETSIAVVKGATEAVSLTVSNETDKNYTNSMLLMPQTKVALGKTDGTAYMGVYCEIYNMAGDAYADSDIMVFKGWALVGVDVNWVLGKKYIYTFNFVDGNGGTDGGEEPENPNPGTDPVLFTIDYNVTVDDFDLMGDSTVEMKK